MKISSGVLSNCDLWVWHILSVISRQRNHVPNNERGYCDVTLLVECCVSMDNVKVYCDITLFAVMWKQTRYKWYKYLLYNFTLIHWSYPINNIVILNHSRRDVSISNIQLVYQFCNIQGSHFSCDINLHVFSRLFPGKSKGNPRSIWLRISVCVDNVDMTKM